MDVRKLRKAAREQGWKIDETRKGHLRFTPPQPDRQICIFGGTPPDQRAVRNFVAQLRRQGFVWPWPPPKKRSRRGGGT